MALQSFFLKCSSKMPEVAVSAMGDPGALKCKCLKRGRSCLTSRDGNVRASDPDAGSTVCPALRAQSSPRPNAADIPEIVQKETSRLPPQCYMCRFCAPSIFPTFSRVSPQQEEVKVAASRKATSKHKPLAPVGGNRPSPRVV